MITALIFIIVLSILVLIHEFGHFIVAKKNGIFVEEFGLGLPPRIFGIKIGETLYSLNLLPIGGFVKVLGEEEAEKKDIPKKLQGRTFYSKSLKAKSAVIIAGVVCNFLLGWVLVSYLFTKGMPVPTTTVTVTRVEKNSPAFQSGLQKGDIITDLSNGTIKEKLDSNQELIDLTKAYAGKELTLTVKRNDSVKSLKLTPRKKHPKNQGPLGVSLKPYDFKKYSPLEAPFYGLYHTSRITFTVASELLHTFGRLITFQKPGADIAGPFGIAVIVGEAAKVGLDPLLQLMAILSLNLAVINIFPFPALDGGRLAMILYEGITKRKINPSIERKLNLAGFAILLTLILLVTISDLVKIVTK